MVPMTMSPQRKMAIVVILGDGVEATANSSVSMLVVPMLVLFSIQWVATRHLGSGKSYNNMFISPKWHAFTKSNNRLCRPTRTVSCTFLPLSGLQALTMLHGCVGEAMWGDVVVKLCLCIITGEQNQHHPEEKNHKNYNEPKSQTLIPVATLSIKQLYHGYRRQPWMARPRIHTHQMYFKYSIYSHCVPHATNWRTAHNKLAKLPNEIPLEAHIECRSN